VLVVEAAVVDSEVDAVAVVTAAAVEAVDTVEVEDMEVVTVVDTVVNKVAAVVMVVEMAAMVAAVVDTPVVEADMEVVINNKEAVVVAVGKSSLSVISSTLRAFDTI